MSSPLLFVFYIAANTHLVIASLNASAIDFGFSPAQTAGIIAPTWLRAVALPTNTGEVKYQLCKVSVKLATAEYK